MKRSWVMGTKYRGGLHVLGLKGFNVQVPRPELMTALNVACNIINPDDPIAALIDCLKIVKKVKPPGRDIGVGPDTRDMLFSHSKYKV
jgi:hypothetical protein